MMENCCRKEIELLSKELNNLAIQSKQLKTEYQRLLIQNLKLDVEIIELKHKDEVREMDDKYRKFESIISASVLEQLKLLGDTKKDDPTFVFLILNDLYGQSLKDKTLSGRTKNSSTANKNTEVSQQTKSILQGIFEERLMKSSSEEKSHRMVSLNKHIRSAIDKSKRGI